MKFFSSTSSCGVIILTWALKSLAEFSEFTPCNQAIRRAVEVCNKEQAKLEKKSTLKELKASFDQIIKAKSQKETEEDFKSQVSNPFLHGLLKTLKKQDGEEEKAKQQESSNEERDNLLSSDKKD